MLGVERLDLPYAGGQIVPALEPPSGTVLWNATDATGALTVSGHWPTGLPDHMQVLFQVWVDDPSAPAAFAASNALAAITP